MKSGKETGSRYSDGNVPNVNWNSNNSEMNVNWYNPGNANDNLCSREKFLKKKSRNYGISLIIFKIFYPAVRHSGNFL